VPLPSRGNDPAAYSGGCQFHFASCSS
jgi:hypothetical protein